MQELGRGHAMQPGAEPNARMAHLTPGHLLGAAAGGAALGGLAAMHSGRPEGENARPEGGMQRAMFPHGEAAGERNPAARGGAHNVPPAPRFANPRPIAERGFSKQSAGVLPYRSGVNLFPHQGTRQNGVPGIYDPGAYVRTPQRANTIINRAFARQQLASIPNYRAAMALNGRNILASRSAWPWQVPASPAWYNPFSWQNGGGGFGFGNFFGGGNPYAYGNPYGDGPYGYPYGDYPYGAAGFNPYWDSWNNFGDWDGWNSQYANCDPFYGAGMGPLGLLVNFFEGSSNEDFGGIGVVGSGSSNWIDNLLYFDGYSVNGNTYPINYFAMNGFVPTPYVFDVNSGQFWQPGVGYSDVLPSNYQAPIAVHLQEVVPSFDGRGRITGYKPQPFCYNAFWDNNSQAYGYYDYRSKFHWLTFPGLQSYSSESLAPVAPPAPPNSM
jgi:hypothetical protein